MDHWHFGGTYERKNRSSSAAITSSQRDRSHTLDALHLAERMASSPGPARAEAWRDDLLHSLEELGATLHEQHRDSRARQSLLSEVKSEAPHLISSVDELLAREDRLAERIDDTVRVMADLSRPVQVETVRSDLAELTREIRELRAWETDIVYEAYAVDLGVSG